MGGDTQVCAHPEALFTGSQGQRLDNGVLFLGNLFHMLCKSTWDTAGWFVCALENDSGPLFFKCKPLKYKIIRFIDTDQSEVISVNTLLLSVQSRCV